MADGADRVWVDDMPSAYERLVPAVFEPFARDLVQRTRTLATGPARILELAAGTGVVTRHLVAAHPDAHVTATDLNQAMVELGRTRVPQAEWRQADALALPFDDSEQFDLIVCQFGVMFFPDKRAAFAEARRVLAPGATLAVSTWAPLPAHDLQAALVDALAELFPDDPPRFMQSVPHGYADPDALAADLADAGLADTAIEAVTLEGRADAATDLAAGYCAGTPIRAEIEARHADLAATIDAVADRMAERLGTPPTGEMTAYVARASA